MLKTLLLRVLLLGTPLALPSCCGAAQVPVAAPRVPCPIRDPGPVPQPASAAPCGDQVCMSPADATTIWTWMRDARRAVDAGKTCTAGGV